MQTDKLLTFLLLTCLGTISPLFAHSANLPSLTGEISSTATIKGESLMEVARRTGLGFENIVNANPDIDPWIPPEGMGVILPQQSILPTDSVVGLTVNLAEMRLFAVLKNDSGYHVRIYPLGIGREGRNTPEGLFRVSSKTVAPIWRVPEGLRESDPSLPELVQPGPDNPLGHYWLGLSAPGYGIHGTNRPLGVGRRVSYGCLRMYPEQIEDLYPQIAVGTPVRIVYQPVKAGWLGDLLLLEVHPDYRQQEQSLFQQAMTAISRTGAAAEVDYKRVKEVVERQNGIPQRIGQKSENNKGELN